MKKDNEENEKIAIIIDCDPGVDDTAAIALSLYDDFFDLKLITTVSGNKDINIVTRNILHVLELFNRTDIPVAKGSGRALYRISPDASYIHQNTGMGGYNPPKTVKTQPIKKHAVEAMYEVIKQNAGNICIIALGPQTNIAKLILKHPDVKSMVNHIYTEGSASYQTTSNPRWTEHKSFNARTDPEAVDIVINSGIPITYVPSEMGREGANFSEEEINYIKSINDVGRFLWKMYSGYWEPGYPDKRIATNDTCAVLAMRFPSLFKTELASFSINTTDKPGKTIITKNPKGNVNFAIAVDKQRLHEFYFNAVKKLNRIKIDIKD